MRMKNIIALLAIVSCVPCFSGGSCSIMSAAQTTLVTNIEVKPALLKKGLSMAALLMIATTYTVDNIGKPDLTSEQKEEIVVKVKKEAQDRIAQMKKQQKQELQQIEKEVDEGNTQQRKLARKRRDSGYPKHLHRRQESRGYLRKMIGIDAVQEEPLVLQEA